MSFKKLPKTVSKKSLPSSAVQKKKKKVLQKRNDLVPGHFLKERVERIRYLDSLDLAVAKTGKPSLPSPLSRRMIPFLREEFSKGTQAPTVRLYLQQQAVLITASNTIPFVQGLGVSDLLNWSSWDQIFSEYRFVRGEVQFMPIQTTSAQGLGVVEPAIGVISYREGDSGTPATYDSLNVYDTKKWFIPTLVGSYGDSKLHITRWPVSLDDIPDQEWRPIDDTGTPAYWKCFGSVIGNTSTQVGLVTAYMDVQFRGLQ
jgi:hypothetical protein